MKQTTIIKRENKKEELVVLKEKIVMEKTNNLWNINGQMKRTKKNAFNEARSTKHFGG